MNPFALGTFRQQGGYVTFEVPVEKQKEELLFECLSTKLEQFFNRTYNHVYTKVTSGVDGHVGSKYEVHETSVDPARPLRVKRYTEFRLTDVNHTMKELKFELKRFIGSKEKYNGEMSISIGKENHDNGSPLVVIRRRHPMPSPSGFWELCCDKVFEEGACKGHTRMMDEQNLRNQLTLLQSYIFAPNVDQNQMMGNMMSMMQGQGMMMQGQGMMMQGQGMSSPMATNQMQDPSLNVPNSSVLPAGFG